MNFDFFFSLLRIVSIHYIDKKHWKHIDIDETLQKRDRTESRSKQKMDTGQTEVEIN